MITELTMADLPETFVEGFHNEEDVRKMEYSFFGGTGMRVSKLSLGTAGFSWLYGDYSLEECKATLHEAVKSGVNYIDTAPWYGQGVSEEVLGKSLVGIPRKAYYLATKVGRYERDPKLMFDFSAQKTRESVEKSLKKLGVDYVDVIQVHDLEFAPSLDIIINETLPTLEEIVKAGKARFIGITGYPVSTLVEVLKRSKTKISSLLSYARLTLIDQTLRDFIPYLNSLNIGVINAACLAMGLLTNGGPQAWNPAQEDIKVICTEARNYCKEKNVELAKLATHFAFQQSGVNITCIGMNTTELLRSNLDVLFNGLTKEERDVLDYLQGHVFTKLTNRHWEGVEIANLHLWGSK